MQNDSVLKHAKRNFMVLRANWTIEQALAETRTAQVPGPIIYFYVVDDDARLVGVLPTRALLTSPLDTKVDSLMVQRLVTLRETSSVGDASELFVMHRFLAIPIVNQHRQVVGVIDINVFSDEVLDLAERRNVDSVFETLGFRMSEARDASAIRGFRLRMPWLGATIGGGTLCALLAGQYGATLEQSIVLAFFLTLVLGLGESVAMQSMTLTVQALRTTRPTFRWFARAGAREFLTAAMLGTVCGATTGTIVTIAFQDASAAIVIGASISIALVCAAVLGISVPTILHALRLDPRVAAGPLTLALADLCTLAVYFNAGTIALQVG